MIFSEALRCGGHLWDPYYGEFDGEALDNDWVLVSRGYAPIQGRIILVFDESFLELGESAEDAAKQWGKEAGDIFDVKFVSDVKEELGESEGEGFYFPLGEEDEGEQYWEDERWRDNL